MVTVWETIVSNGTLVFDTKEVPLDVPGMLLIVDSPITFNCVYGYCAPKYELLPQV